MAKKTVKELVKMIDAIKGTSFVSLMYRNAEGEKSKYIINVGIKHSRVVKRDLETLAKLRNDVVFVKELQKDYGLLVETCFNEIEKSLKESLEGGNVRGQAQHDAYVKINEGIKLGLESHDLYLYGYLIDKTVIEPVTYKPVKHRIKTLCKNRILKQLKSTRYRVFKIDSTNTVVTGGKMLVIE
jgi:hypothetical protein